MPSPLRIAPPAAPPDQAQRDRAIDPRRSILVRAPAGSGKTDLLTRRFLRLLACVDDPSHVVAITFTRAAAAEMRHRILAELEKAAARMPEAVPANEFSMEALAAHALEHSRRLNWNLLELPAQLRISTIDSFCREISIQQPLLSGFAGSLEVIEQPDDLYRRAARRTMQRLADADRSPAAAVIQEAIESLLLWRDNNWHDVEEQLVAMLGQRDRWMHGFVLDRDPDWDELRRRLERPFARGIAAKLSSLGQMLSGLPDLCDEAMEMARFACEQNGSHRDLAELAELPCGPFESIEELEAARRAYLCLADLLLTKEGTIRKSVNIGNGFPPDRAREKQRMKALLQQLNGMPELASALHAARDLPSAGYTEAEWQIVRACFTLLRHAAAELKVIFAEAGVVDFTEVSQAAQHVLQDADGLPSDAALAVADGIHHLLIDEFQDTSRRQHKLVASIAAAWPDSNGRTIFVVGDPMQSIYFFRDADAELFPRVQLAGLDLPNAEPLPFDFVPLTSNFRTAPELVRTLNQMFAGVFSANDRSGVQFSSAEPARTMQSLPGVPLHLHLDFVPQPVRSSFIDTISPRDKLENAALREAALQRQLEEIVALIRSHSDGIAQARARGDKFRIAVLGRTRSALAPIAAALRNVSIPFRALDLEPLAERPEVLDVLALTRAVLLPQDRVAWLGVLRAPWCGLSLADIHALTSGDDPETLRKPVPELLVQRAGLLSDAGRTAIQRVLRLVAALPVLRAQLSASALGTRMKQIWLSLGGDACVDATARVNLDLLWSRLDMLSADEPALLGGQLAAALEKLMAQPDPLAENDYGVQLMTIHKSKGLEFEVVVVPDLHARCASTHGRLLSWLERGLAEAGDDGDVTEFLVAPLQRKGEDRGSAKEWVDREHRLRESQEMRRILYVAATRAREELHFFARPSYKTDATGELTLCDPAASLLATAWPALQDQASAAFEKWRSKHTGSQLSAIAAQAESNVIQMPSPRKPTRLRRLPDDFEIAGARATSSRSGSPLIGFAEAASYRRHEGGLVSRALGSAVHALFERAAVLRATTPAGRLSASLQQLQPRTVALIRSAGLPQPRAAELAAQAMEIVLRALADPRGAWIVSTHADAASEAEWSGVIDGAVHSVRADRVFRAGAAPGDDGETTWWIVDYKTSHPDGNADELLSRLRPLFAPQLEYYAQFLRKLHGNGIDLRAGLYYPRLLKFDCWKP